VKRLFNHGVDKNPSSDAVALPLTAFDSVAPAAPPLDPEEVLPHSGVIKTSRDDVTEIVPLSVFDSESQAVRTQRLKQRLQADFSDPNQRRTTEEIEAIAPTPEELRASEEAAEQEKKLAEQMKAGFDQGYQDGLGQGREEAEKQARIEAKAHFSQMIDELNQLALSVEKPLTKLDEEVIDQLVTLVKTLVKQLVRREIKTDTGQIVGAVRQAMDALPANSRKVHLQLNPQDIALVREAFSVAEDDPVWTIVEVPSLARGNCLVETEVSVIDMTLDARLDALFAQVFGGRTSDS